MAKVPSTPPVTNKVNVWKIQMAARPVAEVMIDVEPGDQEKFWSRLTPATFMCEEGRPYTFTVPEQVGYDQFKHWENPRTDQIVSTEPVLVLENVKRNDRYVAVYEQRIPCDVVFHGVTSKSHMKVYADKPDINGRTEIVTPGRLTYMFGEKVTFKVDPRIEVSVPDVLYKHLKETYLFTGWRQGTDIVAKDLSLEVIVPRRGMQLTVTYARTPAPFTPDDRQVHVMAEQLNLLYTKDTRGVREFIVLVNGIPIKVLGKLLFPTKENALAALQGSFHMEYRDWLSRLPERLKEWCLEPKQRKTFFDYWLRTAVEIIPFNKLEITIQKDDKAIDKT